MQAFSQKANYSDGIIFMIFHIIAYSYCLDLSGRAKPASVCKISEKLQVFEFFKSELEFFKSELHKKTARPANKYQTGATPRQPLLLRFSLSFPCRPAGGSAVLARSSGHPQRSVKAGSRGRTQRNNVWSHSLHITPRMEIIVFIIPLRECNWWHFERLWVWVEWAVGGVGREGGGWRLYLNGFNGSQSSTYCHCLFIQMMLNRRCWSRFSSPACFHLVYIGADLCVCVLLSLMMMMMQCVLLDAAKLKACLHHASVCVCMPAASLCETCDCVWVSHLCL